MKSRGVYETPGGTILLAARRALESITLDRGEAHLKDDLMPRCVAQFHCQRSPLASKSDDSVPRLIYLMSEKLCLCLMINRRE